MCFFTFLQEPPCRRFETPATGSHAESPASRLLHFKPAEAASGVGPQGLNMAAPGIDNARIEWGDTINTRFSLKTVR
jgi:hypothetical protein